MEIEIGWEVEDLVHNSIVNIAFERMIFGKIRLEGYCDINHLIGKPKITKNEITENLKRLNSPLVKCFSENNVSTCAELKKILLPVLYEIEKQQLSKENIINEYFCFAIIHYLLHIYKSYDLKLEFIKKQCLKKFKNIEEKNGIIYDADVVNITIISSVKQYVEFINEIRKIEANVYFRGHSKVSYELKPSLFRNEGWLRHEKEMYLELLSKCPNEFEHLASHIEKLAEMQHYGLPTRLLDITLNPLIALYFACETQHSYQGEIVVLTEQSERVKYFQSDTVAMLASLPLFTEDEQRQFYNWCADDRASNTIANHSEIERLVHEVRMERPGFKSQIHAGDLREAIICIPARKSKRIENQDGAFVVCGLLDEIYGKKKNNNTVSKLRLKIHGKIAICIVDKKEDILSELGGLGINKAKIYPELDDVADYIKSQFNQPK